jgi:mannitol 2-dehydrogenase
MMREICKKELYMNTPHEKPLKNNIQTQLSLETLEQLSHVVSAPLYDRKKLIPSIVHIGVGAFHRSHQAVYLNTYAQETGDLTWGILGAGVLPSDAKMQEALKAQDFLFCVIEKGTHNEQVRIIGSHTGMIVAPENQASFIETLASSTIKIVTLTITEGGYKINSGTGHFMSDDPDIIYDLAHPTSPKTVFGYLAAALQVRKSRGLLPFTILSCDNVQENGSVCKKALFSFCSLVDSSLAEWLMKNGAFPNSMVDRITPATTDEDRTHLQEVYGIIDNWPVVAEPFLQWVIEDSFTLGRPALEKVGVQFAPDIAPYEKMKLRLLNASHSIMGYLGYLCGYQYIHEIAADARFSQLVRFYMKHEARPTLDQVPGIDIDVYCATLIERFKNPAIKDQTLRICRNGSAKIPGFILPVIEDLKRQNKDLLFSSSALVVASWWRFMQGVDEQGNEISLQDSMVEKLQPLSLSGIEAFLDCEEIFGVLSKDEQFRKEVKLHATRLVAYGAQETLELYLRDKTNV